MKSCFSGIKNKQNLRTQRAQTWPPPAAVSHTGTQELIVGGCLYVLSPCKILIYILMGELQKPLLDQTCSGDTKFAFTKLRKKDNGWKWKEQKTQLINSSAAYEQTKAPDKIQFFKVWLACRKPRSWLLQNITCNKQYIKYPAFVGVCKNEGQGFTENFYVGQKWMCYLFSKLK